MKKAALLLAVLLGTVSTACQTVSSLLPEKKEELKFATGFKPEKVSRLGHLHVRFPQKGKGFVDIPKSYKAPITPVRDQGNCGSCFVFASIAAVEGAAKANALGDFDLSEQAVLDCSTINNYKCQGGWDQFEYLKTKGAPHESAYPYTARAATCQLQNDPNGRYKNIAPDIDNFGFIGPTNGSPSAREVAEGIYRFRGAVWISIAADADLNNPVLDANGVFRKCSSSVQENHVVQAYGYEEDPENPGQYLIDIKNSWGKGWNKNGLMRLPFGCKKLGKTTMFVSLKQNNNPTPEPQPQPEPTPTPTPTPTPDPAPGPTPGPTPPGPCTLPKMKLPALQHAIVGDTIRTAVIPEAGFTYGWYLFDTKIADGPNLDRGVLAGRFEYVVKATNACGQTSEVRTKISGL